MYNLSIYPLTSIYTDVFEKYNIKYDVIYLDRIGLTEACDAYNTYSFSLFCNLSKIKFIKDNFFIKKMIEKIRMFQYKNYIKTFINKNRYDFVVLWGEDSVVFLSEYISKKLPYKYSVNIRDIWKSPPVKYLKKLKISVDHSAFNTVSSDGFVRYLPRSKYIFVHNANKQVIEKINFKPVSHNQLPINILTIGTFRGDHYAFDIMDSFANDTRFRMLYIGRGTERIDDYCKSKCYKNYLCKGTFDISETAEYLKSASIINCAYGADNIAEISKIPIRFYYAIYLGIPVLATQGTRIEHYSKKNFMGIILPQRIRSDDLIADAVYTSYQNLPWKKMNEKINEFKKEIDTSHKIVEKEVCATLNID